MGKKIEDVRTELTFLDKNFPRPGIQDLTSKLKDLEYSYYDDWPKHWEKDGFLRKYAETHCVYFFFDEHKNLLYIGATKTLGHRFYKHFDSGNAKWRDLVYSLAILPIPEPNWFELHAIEAFLIYKLQPPKNIVGK